MNGAGPSTSIRVPDRARREMTRFWKFSVVGTIGAVVDFGCFNLLRSALGLASIPSSVVSFVAAVTNNFLWNRYWTYPDSRSKRAHRQGIQFVVVNLVGLAVRTPVFAFLERPAIDAATGMMSRGLLAWLPPSSISPATLGRNLALAAAVLIVLIWNFLANRYWTYSDVT